MTPDDYNRTYEMEKWGSRSDLRPAGDPVPPAPRPLDDRPASHAMLAAELADVRRDCRRLVEVLGACVERLEHCQPPEGGLTEQVIRCAKSAIADAERRLG
ncbi:MAG TPA: hypothetical protein VJ547_11920 [Candidatus Thermoplasmatota archaeon]|nr:hypothetical protein [Candidatus Thermoplasmatota archaeon]